MSPTPGRRLLATARLDDSTVLAECFTRLLVETFRDGAGFVRFLCRALDVPF